MIRVSYRYRFWVLQVGWSYSSQALSKVDIQFGLLYCMWDFKSLELVANWASNKELFNFEAIFKCWFSRAPSRHYLVFGLALKNESFRGSNLSFSIITTTINESIMHHKNFVGNYRAYHSLNYESDSQQHDLIFKGILCSHKNLRSFARRPPSEKILDPPLLILI